MDALRRSVAEAKERRGEGGAVGEAGGRVRRRRPTKAPAKKAAAKSADQEGSQEDHRQEGGYDEEGGGQEDRHPSVRLASGRRPGHSGIPPSASVLW